VTAIGIAITLRWQLERSICDTRMIKQRTAGVAKPAMDLLGQSIEPCYISLVERTDLRVAVPSAAPTSGGVSRVQASFPTAEACDDRAAAPRAKMATAAS
jgi:hypothetical protein